MEGTKGATLSAMFMAAGLVSPTNSYTNYNQIADAISDHCGQIEVFQELAYYGELADEIFQDYWKEGKEGAGVFDYEVSEEFGTWFGEYIIEHKRMPTQIVGETELRRLAKEFFERAENEQKGDTLRDRVEQLAGYCCREARNTTGSPWYLQERRQAMQDALQAMMGLGIIRDYDIAKGTAVIPDTPLTLVFVPKQKEN